VISPVCASMENFGRSPGALTNVYVIVPPLSGGSLSNALTWQRENGHVWDLSERETHSFITIIIIIIVDIIIIIIVNCFYGLRRFLKIIIIIIRTNNHRMS